MVDAGVLEDLGPYARRDKIDPSAVFLPKMIEAWTHNGKLYALPMSVSTDVVGYNKDLFDGAGVKHPPVNLDDKAWTMDAFLEAARKITRAPEQYGFSGGLNRANPAGATEGTYFGQPPWDDAKKKCLMNTPNFVKGLQFFLDLKDKWRVQPDPDRARELAGPQNVPLFLTGRVAMHAVGGEIIGQTIPFKWALASIPYSGAGKNTSGRHWSQGLHLDSGSKVKEAAWRVYRWLMEPANNVEYTIPFGQPVTALKAAQEALQKRWTQETGVDGRAYALTASVSLPSGGGMLKYGTWPKVLEQLTPLYTDMREGRISVKDYADRATAIVDRDLAPNK
jgi:multiple sugar transport system substrate-binding protein